MSPSLRSHHRLFTFGPLLLALLGPACGDVNEPDTGGAELALEPGPPPGPPPFPGPGAPTPQALGFWQFDDCNPAVSELADSSGNGLTAARSAGVACAEGISGLAAAFDQSQDLVEVPHQPAISFDQHVTAGAWVRPSAVDGKNPIVFQRAQGKTSFHLAIEDGEAVFLVTLTTGQIVSARAPVSGDAWVHLAGSYDGQFLFLFINGQRVGQIAAAGSVLNVNGPVRIGQGGVSARFDGLIDDVFLANSPVSIAQVEQLSCVRRPMTVSTSVTPSGPVPPETSVTYELTVTNNDIGACSPSFYNLSLAFDPALDLSSFNVGFEPTFPGESAVLSAGVTSSSQITPGVYDLLFEVIDQTDGDIVPSPQTYEVVEPTGCFVRPSRELLVRHLSVVEDPIRTTPGDPADPRAGAWTFGRLMENMAPTPADAPAMVEQLFQTWLTDQSVNGFVVPARPSLQQLVLDPWPRRPDGALDLGQAPLRLLAIVNRIDLRDLSAGRAGEGRFVFGVVGPQDGIFPPPEFTVILEYNLPAATEQDVLDWANAWHALGSLPFPSEAYNAALQAITDQFTGRGADPSRPNGSALSQLRTNEIALAAPWELREFKLSPATGFLVPDTVKLTPDLSFNGTEALAGFVNANEAAILAEQHVVPDLLGGAPFLAGSSLNDGFTPWSAPGIASAEARQRFSLNTCNGCHGFAETRTDFTHVKPRFAGEESALSGFMTGITVPDPVTDELRTFNDLGRRAADLRVLVCAPEPSAKSGGGAEARAASTGSIARGIRRVH